MDWLAILNNILNTTPHLGEIAMRLACAMLVGLVIGTEREYTHRPAGMRTHILVSLGACVVSVTGELMFHHYMPLGSTLDPARLSAQVITGVGFLGAGTIMREGVNVKGLTTAASVWSVACLGIASGFGFYGLAILGMVFILVTLTFFEWIQNRLINPQSSRQREYTLETGDISQALAAINAISEEQRVTVSRLSTKTLENGFVVRFNASFPATKARKNHEKFFNALAAESCIRSVYTDDEAIPAK